MYLGNPSLVFEHTHNDAKTNLRQKYVKDKQRWKEYSRF